VVVLRDVRGHDGPPLSEEDLGAVTLLDGSLRPIEGLDGLWVVRAGDAAAYWRLPLPPGPYAIRQAAAAGEVGESPDVLDQAVWVSGGWQTIVFLLRSEPGARVAWPSIQMAPLTRGWQPDRPGLGTAYELALWELRNPAAGTLLDGGTTVTPDAVADDPMLAIVSATALLRSGRTQLARAVALVDTLGAVLPDHPDVAGLRAAARLAGATDVLPPSGVAWPPTLAELYLALMRHDAAAPGTIATDSAAEVIATRLALSGIWTTWRPIDREALPPPPPDDAPSPEATLERIAREPRLVQGLRPTDPADRRVVAFLESVVDLEELDPGVTELGSLGPGDVAAATHLPDAVARQALRRIGLLLPPPGSQGTNGDNGGGNGGGSSPPSFPTWTAIAAAVLFLAVALGTAVALGVVRWPSEAVSPSPSDLPSASATQSTTGAPTAPPPSGSAPSTPVPTPVTPAPILSLEVPPVFDFGQAEVGTEQVAPMGIRNSGTGPVVIQDLVVASGDVEDFGVDDTACVPAPRPPNLACEVLLRFTPLEPGRREAQLLVLADAVEPPPIPLVGSGREGVLLLDPPALEYTAVSLDPVPQKVNVVATDGPVAIESVTLGGRFEDEYRVSFTDCEGATLQRDQSCSATVEYVPPNEDWSLLEQPRTADLRIASTGGQTYTVPLQARLNIID
jgi:hypothetical protein